MKGLITVPLLIGAVTLAGCSDDPKSPQGFSLPEGDARMGRSLFQTLQCNACHAVEGIQQLNPDAEGGLSITLGGEVSRIKTYGELVTSIINPSHRLAKGYPLEEIQVDGTSKMRNYNDTMTVSQLIDLVAFLQSQYKLEPYPNAYYPLYDFPSYDEQP